MTKPTMICTRISNKVGRSVRSQCRLVAAIMFLWATPVYGEFPYEQPPINYSKAAARDPVARLKQAVEMGEVVLEHDDKGGYLRSVLEHLKVPIESQGLVFSKTSLQFPKISPRTPRAIYFNDDVYVGFVQRGDVLELSAADPELGAVFYTVDQAPEGSPRIVRHSDNCLTCHATSRTSDVPGHLVRSVYPDITGQPVLSSGTFVTTQDSPFEQRWGGWYVTGKHGSQRHMGNVYVRDRNGGEKLDTAAGANVTDLRRLVDVEPYLSPHSDLVALLVLEHQTQMHNLITRASFEGRAALHYNEAMNKAFRQSADVRSESTVRRLNNAAELMLKYLLFIDEPPLAEPVEGTSGFAEQFATAGPRDKQGRSLRDLDLKTRTFKYRCSFLIYSPAIDALPQEVKDRFYQRLWEILSSEDQSADFAKLSAPERRAVLEILRDTKPNLPEYWRKTEP